MPKGDHHYHSAWLELNREECCRKASMRELAWAGPWRSWLKAAWSGWARAGQLMCCCSWQQRSLLGFAGPCGAWLGVDQACGSWRRHPGLGKMNRHFTSHLVFFW